MGTRLEQEAERLKEKYPSQYQERIEHNLNWIIEEISLQPRSVDINDGFIAMSAGLPYVTPRPRPKQRKKHKGDRRRNSRR